jgi:hypothetical protein
MRNLVALLSVVLCLAGSGCGKSQSENCKKLIACSEALSPGTGAAMETSYGASGNCWKSGDAAAACTSACDAAMTSYKAMPSFATTAACK